MPSKLWRLLPELLNYSDDITEEYCNSWTFLIYLIVFMWNFISAFLFFIYLHSIYVHVGMRTCMCVCVCVQCEKRPNFFQKNLPIKFTMRKSAKNFECCSSSVVCCSSQGPATFLFFFSVPATVKVFRIF